MTDRDDRRDREELDERVAELEDRVRELRGELGRPPRGAGGLPRPPTPREVLSFTGEYAIPTAVAVLEANIRALEALERIIRVLDPEQSAVAGERDRLESRAADASRATLDRLEDALEDVEATIRESDLPREGEARDILEDARRINREIRERVERGTRDADEARRNEREDREDDVEDRGTTIELSDPDEEDEGEDEHEREQVDVDVDAELRSIKDEIEGREEEVAGDGDAGDASGATDASDATDAGDASDTGDATDDDNEDDED